MTTGNDIASIVKGFLRSLAQYDPTFAALGQAWEEFESHEQQARVAKFLKMLGHDMIRIKERIMQLEKHLVQNKDFPFLIERVVEKVRRESSDRKVAHFSRLLSNCMAADPSVPHEEKLNFIDTLDILTDSDIQIFSEFAKRQRLRIDSLDSVPIFNWSTIGQSEPAGGGVKLSNIIVSISKLEARGLITESIEAGGAFGWSGDASHWINRWRRKSYELLPFGARFLTALAQ